MSKSQIASAATVVAAIVLAVNQALPAIQQLVHVPNWVLVIFIIAVAVIPALSRSLLPTKSGLPGQDPGAVPLDTTGTEPRVTKPFPPRVGPGGTG